MFKCLLGAGCDDALANSEHDVVDLSLRLFLVDYALVAFIIK
ncbi:hypothetical protein [Nitrosomonas sp. Nm33]|nr:hypothetical protein [Nitrosomonas sp. Nm33]